jgi:acyl-coenzyme A synthetase/AMP-(fatty) acid ligase
VKNNLARFASPRDVEFLDELPRNNTGKVLKSELGPVVSAMPVRGARARAHTCAGRLER